MGFSLARVLERLYDVGVLQKLEAVIDELCAMDPAALADTGAMKVLHRSLARLEAATTRAVAAFDTGRAWADDGARSAAGWLAVCCSLPRATAQRRTHLGRSLRHLPASQAAWVAGDIGEAHVAAVARARAPVTEVALSRDEAMLVGQAKKLRFDHFCRVLSYWGQHADPDGSEDTAADQRDGRRLHLSPSLDGTWVGDMVLDPIGGAVVSNQLKAIETELFEADWADAGQRVGEAAVTYDLARTPAQRRADALVEMARRAGTADPNGRRPEPLFTVLVGYETLSGRVCELANGTVVTPGSLVPWLDQCWIERVVFDSPSRVIDVGVARRLFTGATRRAVEVRDRECFHPTCDVPAEQCQIDHIEPYAAGGATNQRNGRPACGQHNRGRHKPPPSPTPEPEPPQPRE